MKMKTLIIKKSSAIATTNIFSHYFYILSLIFNNKYLIVFLKKLGKSHVSGAMLTAVHTKAAQRCIRDGNMQIVMLEGHL